MNARALPTPEKALPTLEKAPSAPAGNLPISAVADLIGKSVERIVGSGDFISRLAKAVGNEIRGDDYARAVSINELPHGHVVVQPKPTALGNVLMLSQVPMVGGQNICVTVLAKDNERAAQPRVEGEELANYTTVLYTETTPGLIDGRRIFSFVQTEDPELAAEFRRQLSTLALGTASFFFMNVLRGGTPQ